MERANPVVVLTGASAGIGAATARAFARLGARLVLAARGQQALEALAAELEARGTAVMAVPTDVSDPAACAALIGRAVERFGRIDVLVNNAGAHTRGDFSRLTPVQVAEMVDVNLRAPAVLSLLALPHLEASRGAIVNVGSLAGCVPLPGAAMYSATKAGLRALTRALAEEVGPRGVTVSVVSPGPVDTGFILGDLEHVADVVLAQPMSSAEQIAELVVQCALDGKIERQQPRLSGTLATLGYVMPWVSRALRPLMAVRGRWVREQLLARERGRGC